MDGRLAAVLRAGGGLATWSELVAVVSESVVVRACRRGELRRLLPGVYTDASGIRTSSPRAVLAWLGGSSALSHLTALAVWGVRPAGPGEPVHVTVPRAVRARSRPSVVVHSRAEFAPEPPHAVVRRGVRVTPLDRALVESWPWLAPDQQRAPVIRAVSDRLTTPDRLRVALAAVPRLPGAGQLRGLLGLLAAGCLSPLEIWGHQRVFTGPGMPAFQRQVPVRLGARTVYLDLFAEAEQVNVELDGATVHGDPRQREIDLRRDSLLAARGILVVRYSHRRLVHEVAAVRRESLAILASRRDPAHDPVPSTGATRRGRRR